MFKKISLVAVVLTLLFGLSACTEPQTDSEILFAIRDEITFVETNIDGNITIPTIENEDVTVTWSSSKPEYLTSTGEVTIPDFTRGDQNVQLVLTLELNDTVVTKAFDFVVLGEERPETIELNTNETDALTLDFEYEAYDFLPDGVGEAELVRCVDGDTAFFREKGGGSSFSVRFLGINTPESTAKFEPWGKPASEYTCDKLTNATTIVLQADPAAGRLDSYGERYLAWVWYDGRLLNLELVEQAYSKASGSTDTLYGDVIFDVNLTVQYTERRVWGETDPDYDYSLEGVQITIEELVTNASEYYGKKVALQGIVSSKLGGAVFIQQGDYGVYVYNRSWAPDLTVGNEIQISGVTVTYYPDENTGALQVSGYQARPPYSSTLSRDNVVTPRTVLIDAITTNDIGSLLKVEGLTVKSIYEGTDGAFTVTAEDADGNTITVRRDADSPDDITMELFTVGTTFDVIGPLSRYMGSYQLMLTNLENIIFE
jgi:micrococcal nuclease